MSDSFEPWPNERLIAPEASFFKRALAVAVSAVSSLRTATVILPKPEGPMGSLGPLDDIEGAIKVDPTFKLIFVSVIVLTLLAFAAWGVVSLSPLHSEEVRSFASGCETLTKSGFGAILGLLGGRTTPSPRSWRRRPRMK